MIRCANVYNAGVGGSQAAEEYPVYAAGRLGTEEGNNGFFDMGIAEQLLDLKAVRGGAVQVAHEDGGLGEGLEKVGDDLKLFFTAGFPVRVGGDDVKGFVVPSNICQEIVASGFQQAAGEDDAGPMLNRQIGENGIAEGVVAKAALRRDIQIRQMPNLREVLGLIVRLPEEVAVDFVERDEVDALEAAGGAVEVEAGVGADTAVDVEGGDAQGRRSRVSG